MAASVRLTRRVLQLLALAMCVCSGSAVASIPKVPVTSCVVAGAYSTSASGACSAAAATGFGQICYIDGKGVPWKGTGALSDANTCQVQLISPDPQHCDADHTLTVGVTCTSSAPVCPPGSSVNQAGTCDCGPGYIQSLGGASCEAVTPKTDAQCAQQFGSTSGDSVTKYDWTGHKSTACHGGCVSTPQNMYGSGSNAWATGPWTTVGGSCDESAGGGASGGGGAGGGGGGESAPAVADPVATACRPPSNCPGLVNGQTVCAPCGSSTDNNTTVNTKTDPAGNVTKGDVRNQTTTDNGDGTTTTVTTTHHPDGSVDTRMTTVPTGSGGTGGQSPDPASFCKANPDSPVCKKSSFGGTCSAAFTCDGDAVQCSIAMEQHQRDCAMFEPSSAGGDWARGAQKFSTAVNDGQTPSWSPAAPGNVVSKNLDWNSTIDRSSSISSACPADVVIGSSGLVLPLSNLCPYLQTLGNFIVAVTAIACAAIMFMGKS
jgi:hypothetical protein